MKEIQKIEEILGVKLEEKQYGKSYDPNQKNTYSTRGEYIEGLRLDNLIIDDFSELFPYLKKLRYLEINNSTIPNFSELLKRNYVDLRLDKVVFSNNNCDTIGNIPRHLIFSNMKFDATCLGCLKKSNVLSYRGVEFRGCHIDNIQEIDNLEQLSLLIFDDITFTHQPKKASKKATRRLSIYNTNFQDFAFLPFSNSLEDIELMNCQIGSIAGLTKFPKLEEITIDSDTTVEDKSVQENTFDKKITCILNQGKQPLDLSVLTSIKNYIDQLELNDYKGKTIGFIEEFKRITHLSFNESEVYVDAFCPIAEQVETICFTKSTIKNANYFSYFKNLTSFKSSNYDEDNNGLRTFEKILPLKNQLKVLDIYECQEINASHLIKEFTALESLKMGYEITVQTAQHILTLKNLKKLSLSIEDKACTLNLKNLTQLEFLSLDTEGNFTGFEHLKQLKSLKIGESISEPTIDINTFPKMESLKRLNLVSYDYEIKGLEQFPNLEALKIKGSPKIKLGRFEHLRVLDLENSFFEDFSTFEELPNLEKLDLSSIQTEMNLEDLYKFPNLKCLTFLESEINDISHLEPLKKLEYLDLFATDISDVRVLNALPNLKEVNLAACIGDDLEEQLDKPEIAIYCYLPSVYLSIWEEDEFGI